MSGKAEIYDILTKASEIFSSKPTRQQLEYLSSKLDGQDAKKIKIAIETFAESNRYFPTYQSIVEEIRAVKSTQAQSTDNCERCKETGTVILFHKKLFHSSAFACRCSHGKKFSYMESEEYAGDIWVSRSCFTDPRAKMTKEQLSEYRAEYWTEVLKNAK